MEQKKVDTAWGTDCLPEMFISVIRCLGVGLGGGGGSGHTPSALL